MTIYTITDWMGLIPLFVCMIFGGIGFIQLVQRKSLFKVDYDIVFLGIYYVIVIFGYLIFEMIPINYRPILIEGFMEASYPSSTTQCQLGRTNLNCGAGDSHVRASPFLGMTYLMVRCNSTTNINLNLHLRKNTHPVGWVFFYKITAGTGLPRQRQWCSQDAAAGWMREPWDRWGR